MQRTTFPLHPAQEDVYIDQLINTESPHYNIGGYIKLKGKLDKEKFHYAVSSAPLAFDAFKMRFDLNEPDSLCHFDPGYEKLEMPELDFSNGDNPSREAECWMQSRFNIPFVIERQSLIFEHYLLKITTDEHWFFGRYHHLITDGYGFIVFINYIALKYKSLVVSDNLKFDYPPYYEEAMKAKKYKNSPEYESDGKYWQDKIINKPQKVLHRKYETINDSAKKSSTYVFNVSKDERILIDDIQASTKSRLQQLTIAALLIYFGKTSNQSEFIFGIPVHKRGSKHLRNILGMFSGIVPHKNEYRQDMLLNNLLSNITHSQKQDYRHHNYPIGDLSRSLKLNASEGYLCEVVINYELLNFEIVFNELIQATVIQLSSEYQRNPLQLSWHDYGTQQPLQLHIHFWDEYFSLNEIELLAQRIIFILKQFPDGLDRSIGSINILPCNERRLLEGFNDNYIKFQGNKTIIELFEKQVVLTPEAVAVVFQDQQLTYKELNERSNQLAYYLRGRGVKEEKLVPICIKRSLEMIVGILGILKAGGAYVPIDPEYPPERINYILEDTEATVVVSSKDTASKLGATLSNLDIVEFDMHMPVITMQSRENLRNTIVSNHLAYVIYTSGSTGKPKGVMIEHRGVINFIMAQSEFYNINNDERILQFSNYCFDASVEQIFLALSNGASLILFPEGAQFDLDLFNDLIIEEKITHLHATPLFLENLHEINSVYLKRVISGGDVCKKTLSNRWKGKVDFYNKYGPTETTITAIEYHDYSDNLVKSFSLPIGKPVANTSIYILDRNEQLCPFGVAGELCIGGVQLARGYLNSPDLTMEKFIPDPFNKEPGSRMYKSGDSGRWLPDGNIEYLGRMDNQVKVRGYRIELGEIESVLQHCECIRHSVVLIKEDNLGDKRLVGYVVANGSFDPEAIISFLKAKLPGYMVPALWMQLESMPLNFNGKIDKKALPDFDTGNYSTEKYVSPRNELETALAGMWKELLQVEKVGIHDNFFELGGHSLIAIQLISRLHKRFNIKTDIGKIFSNPTIKELGEVLNHENKHEFNSINRIPIQDHYELSHAQKRFWVLSHLKDGSIAYSIPTAFVLEGNLEVAHFKQAFNTVIERHEILRTVFVEINGEPWQKILPSSDIRFKIKDIDVSQHPDVETIIKKNVESESSRPFDLLKGPLLRATLFRVNIDRYIFVFNIHHIVSDGWSKGIFINEILSLYKNYCLGVELDLPPLSVQYKDYAAWQTASNKEQARYWKELYKQDIPLLNFPLDFERPKIVSFSGAMLHFPLTEELTQSLKKLAFQHSMTMNNLLFALYGLMVAQACQQDEVVIGTLTSGRSHMDLENMIGLFINFLPIRLSPGKQLRLSQYLINSNDSLVGAYSNQDYPFNLIVEDCVKQRDISRNPFFDTMVNFHWENDLNYGVNLGKDQLGETGLLVNPYQLQEEDFFHSVLDFKLDIEPVGSSIDFHLNYNSLLFTRERMSGFLSGFVKLLTKVVIQPDNYVQQYFNIEPAESETLNIQPAEPMLLSPVLPITICASFITEPLETYLEYWCKEFELNIKVAFAPYNQVFQQLINPDSMMNKNTGMNILFIRIEDWLRDKHDRSPSEQIDFLDQTYLVFITAIEYTRKTSFVPYLIGIVPLSSTHSLPADLSVHILEMNNRLYTLLEKMPGFYLIDLNKIASLYFVEEVFDSKSDELGHIPFTQEYYAALGTFLSRKVRAYVGKSYKVLAVDCDNTLWKGICGEVGAMGVIIDENFSYLQQFILEKHQEGFLLALCSKNNEEDVWEVFNRHPDMKIKRKHIADYRINWKPKHHNIKDIANKLNLGLDSIIFLDDNDFEVEQMSFHCPEVLSLALPKDSNSLSDFLNHIWALDHFQITEEDTQRNTMYKAEKKRKSEQVNHVSLNEFLQSLNIEINLRSIKQEDLPRAAQLTQRTNQFNMNGVRRSIEDIALSVRQQSSLNWIIEVKDRFGDYGIVGLLLARRTQNTLILDSFVLSCRVLGRNVENFVLSELERYCVAHSLHAIEAQFSATNKNKPFVEFLTTTEWALNPETNNWFKNIFN